jgi:hypothetical protein
MDHSDSFRLQSESLNFSQVCGADSAKAEEARRHLSAGFFYSLFNSARDAYGMITGEKKSF